MCPAFKEVSGIVQMERAAVDKDRSRTDKKEGRVQANLKNTVK